jgi:hypothetical protein
LAIEQDEVEHVLLQFACAKETDRRDAQTFLVDVGVAAIGEIGMVSEIDRPGDDRAVDEDRLGHHNVRQVRSAARIGIVANEHVAGAHVRDRMMIEDMRHDADEAAEMNRDMLRLAEGSALHVE